MGLEASDLISPSDRAWDALAPRLKLYLEVINVGSTTARGSESQRHASTRMCLLNLLKTGLLPPFIFPAAFWITFLVCIVQRIWNPAC